MKTGIPTIVLAALSIAGTAAFAQEPDFGASASAGYRYDSNVSLSELDRNLGEADTALLLELGLDGSLPLTDTVTAKASYGFSQVAYDAFSEFDTSIHRLQGDLAWRIAGFDAGLSARRFAANLDGESYLDIRQLSPNVARLFGDTFYLRGAFTASDKDFAERDGRDATNEAFDVDGYWLFDGMRHYLAVGLQVDREEAAAAVYDYAGNRARLTWGRELEELPLILKARVEIENRDYDNVDEAIGDEGGEARRDRRFRAGLTATVPVTDYFGIELESRYGDFRSNLEAADFDETLFSVNLRGSFQ